MAGRSSSMNELPARVLARIAGALYLTNILLGVFALGIVPSALTVAGDAAATAHHIQANELLYRSSLAAHMIVTLLCERKAAPRWFRSLQTCRLRRTKGLRRSGCSWACCI